MPEYSAEEACLACSLPPRMEAAQMQPCQVLTWPARGLLCVWAGTAPDKPCGVEGACCLSALAQEVWTCLEAISGTAAHDFSRVSPSSLVIRSTSADWHMLHRHCPVRACWPRSRSIKVGTQPSEDSLRDQHHVNTKVDPLAGMAEVSWSSDVQPTSLQCKSSSDRLPNCRARQPTMST